jgi:hypothetical protein
MAGLYSILTTGEVLKILARSMWYVEAHPEDVEAFNAPERRGEDRPGHVPLSRLPFHRVRLSGGGIAAQGAAG